MKKKILTIFLVLFLTSSCVTVKRMVKQEQKQEIDSLNLWGVIQANSQEMGNIHIRLNNLERAIEDLRKPYLVEDEFSGNHRLSENF